MMHFSKKYEIFEVSQFDKFGIDLEWIEILRISVSGEKSTFFVGSMKHKTSSQKFIFVRRDASAAIVIERKLILRNFKW